MSVSQHPGRLRGVRLRSPHSLPPTRQLQRSLDRDIERRRQGARERLALDPGGPDAEAILDRFRGETRTETIPDLERAWLWGRYADLRDLSFDDGRDEIYRLTGNI